MLTQGLVIDEPWIGHILAGRKTWEMRSKATKKRGTIALIRKGSGLVVGTATLSECLPALTSGTMQAHFAKHQIPQSMMSAPGYKWFTPWVLTDIRALERPVPYKHPAGAVTFVNLDTDVIDAVLRQGGAGESITRASSSVYEGGAIASPSRPPRSDAALTRSVLAEVGRQSPSMRVPKHATVTHTRRGTKLHIDAVWEDRGSPRRHRSPGGWGELVGVLAAMVVMICMLGFVIHLVLGMGSSSVSALAAFKWLVPLVISAAIATMLGQGHLLDFDQ